MRRLFRPSLRRPFPVFFTPTPHSLKFRLAIAPSAHISGTAAGQATYHRWNSLKYISPHRDWARGGGQ